MVNQCAAVALVDEGKCFSNLWCRVHKAHKRNGQKTSNLQRLADAGALDYDVVETPTVCQCADLGDSLQKEMAGKSGE